MWILNFEIEISKISCKLLLYFFSLLRVLRLFVVSHSSKSLLRLVTFSWDGKHEFFNGEAMQGRSKQK